MAARRHELNLCEALRGRLAGRGRLILLWRRECRAIVTDLTAVGMDVVSRASRAFGRGGSGALAVTAAGGCRAAAAAQAFAFEQESRGQTGKCGQKEDQYGKVKLHGLTPATNRWKAGLAYTASPSCS
jgi:hypothetical protein